MDGLVQQINNAQNGDHIIVTVPLGDSTSITVDGIAEIDSNGNVVIHADPTSIPDIPYLGSVDAKDIVLTIERGDGLESTDTINATLNAKVSKGIISGSIKDAKLSVDLANNTLTATDAVIRGPFNKELYNLSGSYDISNAEFTIYNETAVERAKTAQSEAAQARTDTINNLKEMMATTADSSSETSSVGGADGFTGINPETAKRNIEDFVKQASAAGAYLCYAYVDLFDKLESNWFSQNALEFSNTVNSLVGDAFNDYKTYIKNIYNGAIEAYNYVAASNGLPTNGDSSNSTFSSLESSMDYFNSMALKDVSSDGITGMNINNVRTAKDEFLGISKEGENRLEQISSGIALYDDDNAQQEAFKSTIKAFAAKMAGINHGVVTAIEHQIDSEASKLEAAASESASALQG